MMVVVEQSSEHKIWTEITRRKHEREGQRYASDLTDTEWALIEPHMPAVKRLGRPRETELRVVLDAVLLYSVDVVSLWKTHILIKWIIVRYTLVATSAPSRPLLPQLSLEIVRRDAALKTLCILENSASTVELIAGPV